MAEVLITLVVLGIIAAITIPTLRNSLDEKKFKVPLKKAYSVLSEAFDHAMHFSDYSANGSFELGTFAEILFKNLAVSRVCCRTMGAEINSSDCAYWSSHVIPEDNDCFVKPKSPNNIAKSFDGGYLFKLKDGMSVHFQYFASSDTYLTELYREFGLSTKIRDSFGGNYGKNTQATLIVHVDVNGETGPNIAGKDVHAFVYTKSDGLLPAGVDTNMDTSLASDCNGVENWGCTYDYLMNGE